jgi:biofilm PGA synthesis N-glycosyltransferase PgaC
LNPFKNPTMVFELISHKILRWLSPIFVIFILIINLFLLKQSFYLYLFNIQILFYFLSIIGYLLKGTKILPSFLFIPYYACTVGCSSVLGIVDVIYKKNFITWEPIRP